MTITAAEILGPAPKGYTIKGFPRRRRPHVQSPAEIAARDANWTRGRILSAERQLTAIAHRLAPESDALLTTVSRLTHALLRYNERQRGTNRPQP